MQNAGSAKTLELGFKAEDTIHEKFVQFHRKNGRIYELFSAFAMQLIKKGHLKIGAKMIMERIRWEMATESKESKFAIDNSFIAHYARLFMRDNPKYAGCFETRGIRTP